MLRQGVHSRQRPLPTPGLVSLGRTSESGPILVRLRSALHKKHICFDIGEAELLLEKIWVEFVEIEKENRVKLKLVHNPKIVS